MSNMGFKIRPKPERTVSQNSLLNINMLTKGNIYSTNKTECLGLIKIQEIFFAIRRSHMNTLYIFFLQGLKRPA